MGVSLDEEMTNRFVSTRLQLRRSLYHRRRRHADTIVNRLGLVGR